MRNIKLTISYDGTNYFGWQIQPQFKTVQQTIEKTLSLILQEKIRISGASRTDAKVHAKHQIANFHTNKEFTCSKLLMSLNKLLPLDIRILKVENVCNDFHSQKNAVSKTYRYYIYNAPVSSPFYRNYSWHIPYYMDINLLNTESAYLIGKKNFFSFTGQKASSKTFERIIYEAYWCKKEEFLVFTVTGNGFLKNMVRKIVGSLTAICNKNEEKHFIQYLLSVKDRQEGKYCAPPQGLYLENIKY